MPIDYQTLTNKSFTFSQWRLPGPKKRPRCSTHKGAKNNAVEKD